MRTAQFSLIFGHFLSRQRVWYVFLLIFSIDKVCIIIKSNHNIDRYL